MKMLLSVIIPVYNEERTLPKLIEIINGVPINKEVIIINDGSLDGSRKILDELKFANFKIIHHEKNLGKGASIRTGLKYVEGDIVIIQDADLELDPKEWGKLIKPIIEGKTNVVFGSRFLGKGKVGPLSTYIANKILTLITNLIYKSSLTDMNTCFKVFNASLIPNLKLISNGFDIEPELAAKLLKYGGKIIEVPVSYNPRKAKEGKKIKAIDFFKDLIALIKFRK